MITRRSLTQPQAAQFSGNRCTRCGHYENMVEITTHTKVISTDDGDRKNLQGLTRINALNFRQGRGGSERAMFATSVRSQAPSCQDVRSLRVHHTRKGYDGDRCSK